MIRTRNTRQRGFTLIELLAVIAVVGILATGIITLINPLEQINKANDARRKSDLAEIQKALEVYYQDNGRYPNSNNGRLVGPSGDIPWGSTSFTPYMSVIPKDPAGKEYAYQSTGQSYRIFASLDRENDPGVCKTDPVGEPCITAGGLACGGICNYAVSSPNISPGEL